jgi:hypothetical protein
MGASGGDSRLVSEWRPDMQTSAAMIKIASTTKQPIELAVSTFGLSAGWGGVSFVTWGSDGAEFLAADSNSPGSNGRPHFGQDCASNEQLLPQSGHGARFMRSHLCWSL